jgi:hypothetical protein
MNSLVVDTEDAFSASFSDSMQSESTRITPRKTNISSSGKFDFSRLSMKDEGLHQSIEEMMSTLHFTINKEFNVMAEVSGEDLFHLPEDIQECSIGEQLAFVKDLVHKVCRNYLRVLAPKDTDSLDNCSKKPESRRHSKSRSVVLSQEDCEILCDLLRSPPKKAGPKAPEAPKTPKNYTALQEKYTDVSNNLLESQASLRKKEDEMEHLVDTNIRLRTGCKLMTQQIKSLERQLVDSMEENYKLEDSLQIARTDLSRAKAGLLIDALGEQATPNFLEAQRFSFSNYL